MTQGLKNIKVFFFFFFFKFSFSVQGTSPETKGHFISEKNKTVAYTSQHYLKAVKILVLFKKKKKKPKTTVIKTWRGYNDSTFYTAHTCTQQEAHL